MKMELRQAAITKQAHQEPFEGKNTMVNKRLDERRTSLNPAKLVQGQSIRIYMPGTYPYAPAPEDARGGLTSG